MKNRRKVYTLRNGLALDVSSWGAHTPRMYRLRALTQTFFSE